MASGARLRRGQESLERTSSPPERREPGDLHLRTLPVAGPGKPKLRENFETVT